MSLPPVHPLLIHLSLAFLLISFSADLLAKLFGKRFLGKAAFWSLVLAAFTGGVGIAAGYWDTSRMALSAETRSYMDLHKWVGWTLAALMVVFAVWRWRILQQARRVVTQSYFLGATTLIALTLFQTWYGAELVYSHGAGVAAAGQGIEPAPEAQERLARVREVLAPVGIAAGGIGQKSETDQGRETP